MESKKCYVQLIGRRNEFYYALITKHSMVVEGCLHEQFLFTHADAMVQDRSQFIAAFTLNENLIFKNLDRSEEKVAITGNTALITAVIRIHIIAEGVPVTHHERFTEVYVQQDETWKLLAIHATFIPAA